MEYLVQNSLSLLNIANYMAAIKAQYTVLGLDVASFQHQHLKLFHESIRINRPIYPVVHKPIDISLLKNITSFCDTLEYHWLYKHLYLTAFFAFLRLSNLLPHTVTSFYPSQHLARGNVILSDTAAVPLVKWSKTIQIDRTYRYVLFPCQHCDILAFVLIQALNQLLSAYHGHSNQPLFRIPRSHGFVSLTDSVATNHLSRIC